MAISRKKVVAASRDRDVGSTENLSTDAEIRRFLNGETTGQVVLGALYDQILDEPIPKRLTDLLRK
jgi:hypothetical protein